MKLLSLVVLAALVLAMPASAAPQPGKGKGSGGSTQQPLSFGLASNVEKQDPVEQQSDWPWLPGTPFTNCSENDRCRINPTPCSWDVDDHWLKIATDDYLDAGASVSEETCMVIDANPQYVSRNGWLTWWGGNRGKFSIALSAPSPTLSVEIRYEPQGRTFIANPLYNSENRRYEWYVCTKAWYTPDDSAPIPIPGSNGSIVEGSTEGTGVVSTITATIRNTGSKTVRQISGSVAVVGTNDERTAGCHSELGLPWQTEYPFRWMVSQ